MLRNLSDQSTQVELLPTKRRADSDVVSGTITGTAVDLKGEGRQIMVMLACGDISTTTGVITIQESADNSTYTTLHAFSTTDTTRFTVVDLTPKRGTRYVRAIATFATTESVTIDFGVIGVVYNERYRPSNIS